MATPEQTRLFTGKDWNQAGVIHSENYYPLRGKLAAGQTSDIISACQNKDTKILCSDLPENRQEDQGKADTQPLLSVRDLSVQYDGQMIFDQLSFTLQKGTVYALMGPSGIGKTSLLKTLGGFIPYQGKMIRPAVKQQELQVTERTKKTGKRTWLQKFKNYFIKQPKHPYTMRYIFQNPQDQFLKETVSEEVLLSLKDYANGDKQKQKNKSIELLKDNQLWEMRRQAPFQLSEGQQRRLAVITLLSEQAELILCDEPTYAQDYKNTLLIMDLLVRTAHERGSTIVFTTHDRNIAQHYADPILFLHDISDDKAEGRKQLCII